MKKDDLKSQTLECLNHLQEQLLAMEKRLREMEVRQRKYLRDRFDRISITNKKRARLAKEKAAEHHEKV
jgi:NADPH-dependent ferric siderophore reductase